MAQTRRSTRNSVLGKRTHHIDQPCPRAVQLPTPDPTPKRARTSLCSVDGDGNKENVPPLRTDPLTDSPTNTHRLQRHTSAEVETPTRPRNVIRRRTSISDILEDSLAIRSLTTSPPPSPASLVPIHARVRALLRATCDGSSPIAGRDEEGLVIREFVDSFTNDNAPTMLYISGSPGSGKTALVNSILGTLGSLNTRIISINCMALNNIDELWNRLVEELDNRDKKSRLNPTLGRQGVERAFAKLKPKCILVLDEYDHLATSFSSLLSLLSLPKSTSRTLRVIGIANTHTLTSSSFTSPNCANPISVKTLHFAPYASNQLLSILRSRLAPLWDGEHKDDAKKLLPEQSMVLLTKKLASTTGDVRALFEVLRGGIDRAVAATLPTNPSSNPVNTAAPVVNPSHILAALKAYAPASTKANSACGNSEVVVKVKNLGLHARLALLAIFLVTRRLESGLPLIASSPSLSKYPVGRPSNTNIGCSPATSGIDASQLHSFYSSTLSRSEGNLFCPVGRGEFGDLLGMLEGVGLVSLSTSPTTSSPVKGGKRTFVRSASFGSKKTQGQPQEVKLVEGLRIDEALRGLGIGVGTTPQDVKEEEVRGIWERELGRLGRERKGKMDKSQSSKAVDAFSDATKDK